MTSIHVQIGGDERPLDSADAQWVHQSINQRLAAGECPCIQVRVEVENIHVRLSTANCARGGFGRPPNRDEKVLCELWEHLGLNEPKPDLSLVWPFLVRLRGFLGLRAA